MEWLHRNKPLYPIYYTNPLRFFSVIILVFFSWICIEPWNYALAAEARKHSAKSASNSSKNSPAKSFEDTLKAVQKLIDEMDEAVGSGKDISLDLETLIGHEGNLGQLNKAILAEFAETKAFITEKNLAPVIHDRHSTAVADYKKNFKELNLHLQAIKKLGKAKDRDLPKAVKKAKGFLDKNVKKPRHQPLDPNNLPHRTAKPTKKKPRMTREAFVRDFGMEEEAGKVVPVSYDGKGIPGATFASHPPNDDLPTAADLAETIEVQFTDEINALAEELENNPVKIYNWVRNNIDFVPTYGSIQGANHCLLTKQCNDMDTASLLIALLRTSGIPARYVMGTIELPIDQVMNWVGGFTDEQAAINFIASSGTPVVGVGSGGKIVAVRMEHTWVGAYADYAPSRGSVNEVGEDWIPIDASFKSHISVLNVTIRNSIPFDFPGFLDQIIDTGTIDITQPSITSIEEILMQDTINAYKDQVQAYIDQNYTDPRINDVFGYISIKEQSLGVLPFSLPYKVNVGGEPFTEIPMALRHKINIRASSGPL
ncbi:MAG TPA: transglutaminase-like domain-containing protein, partial [Nitrospiria bacterium]